MQVSVPYAAMVFGDPVHRCLAGKIGVPYLQRKLVIVLEEGPNNSNTNCVISVYGGGRAYHQCSNSEESGCELEPGKK